MSEQTDQYSGVRCDIADGIARITLDKPTQANAMDLAMADGLLAAFEQARQARVVLLTGTGRLFCAGGDVAAMGTQEDRGAFLHELAGRAHQAMLAAQQLPVPIVAAVQGSAAGIGLSLVLHADLVVAESDAKFLTAYLGIGVSPDGGMSFLLPRIIGPRRAAQLALTGQVLRAPQALEWGLVNELSEPGASAQRAAELATAIAAAPPEAIAATTTLLRGGWERPLAEQLDAERDSIARLVMTPDSTRLIDAFVARSRG